MALWIDRTGGVAGPGVRALVIGVSDYQFLPEEGHLPEKDRETLGLYKVDIPATGAFRVAKWLRDKYWHPTHKVKTIRLLLSPSALEMNPPNPSASVLDKDDLNELDAVSKASRAVTKNVRTALLDWQKECRGHPEDIALLYIAGHGIQWGDSDDAIVLLEDFSKDASFLDQSVGIRGTVKGMRNEDMPQIQLYFVDSCRIHPDEYGKFENAGTPFGLPSKPRGPDLRSATIYYAACPQTRAKGRVGRGTYFAEALIDCLDAIGLAGPVVNSKLEIARTHWHINVANLAVALQDRIEVVAWRDQETQEVVPGGMPRPAVFCATPYPPPVTVVIDVTPDDAAKVAFAALWKRYPDQAPFKEKVRCWERPVRLNAVPPGVYILEVSASEPYPPQSLLPVDAKPPLWSQPIRLS